MTEQEKLNAAVLETRKVKALEKIANSLETLTMWFDDINKDEWSERVQYYLSEFHTAAQSKTTDEKTRNSSSL